MKDVQTLKAQMQLRAEDAARTIVEMANAREDVFGEVGESEKVSLVNKFWAEFNAQLQVELSKLVK